MPTETEFEILHEIKHPIELKKFNPSNLTANISKIPIPGGRARWELVLEFEVEKQTYGRRYIFDPKSVSFNYVDGFAQSIINCLDPKASISTGSKKEFKRICDNTNCYRLSTEEYDLEFPHINLCGPCKEDLIRHLSEKRAQILVDRWLGNLRDRKTKAENKRIKENTVVYLIQNGNTNLYKIGVTLDIKSRIANIQTSNPCKVGLVHTVLPKINAAQLESMLHKKYKPKNVHFEWFEFNQEQVDDCIQTMNSYAR